METAGITETLWTIEETAEYLQLAKRTIYKLTCAKLIPHVKLRGALRFEPAEIRAWVDSKRVKAI